MSRFLASSVTADLFGRFFNLLLLVLLLPIVLVIARQKQIDVHPAYRQKPIRTRRKPEAA